MHTEEEAKTKWCPFARLGFEGGIEDVTFAYAANRWADEGAMEACHCIASECMAWRWDTVLNDQLLEDARAKFRDDPEIVEPLKDTQLYQDFLESRHGYCGLAGKPE